MERDPVCGAQVDLTTASDLSEYKGQNYVFCSTACKERFDKDPEHYIGPRSIHAERQPASK